MKIGLAIATYNEATNISSLLDKIDRKIAEIKDASFEVLVVDDSSPDGTAALVKEKAQEINRPGLHLSVLIRPLKNGLGRAYVDGFKHLHNQGVDYLMSMDADFSHDPVYLPDFVKAVETGHDLVIASRYISGGQTPDWPWYRRKLSKYVNGYARFFLSRSISDYTGGFNLYSSDIIKAVNLDTLQATGYGFFTELKFRALQYAKSLIEIPIIFRDRQGGQSKIPKSTIIDTLLLVLRLKFSKGDYSVNR